MTLISTMYMTLLASDVGIPIATPLDDNPRDPMTENHSNLLLRCWFV